MSKVRISILGAILVCGVAAWVWLRWIESSYESPYVEVEENLFIGQSVKEPPAGTSAVVNLCGRKDKYSVEATLWEPVFEGNKKPDIDWLRRIVSFIDEQRKAGRKTYVHCLAGMNRSGAAVTAYLMYEHGWTRDRALAFLQSKRSQVQPNPILMRLLAEWAKELKKGDSPP